MKDNPDMRDLYIARLLASAQPLSPRQQSVIRNLLSTAAADPPPLSAKQRRNLSKLAGER